MHLPNFIRRRRKLDVVTFAPVHRVFKPQVGFVPNRDLNGWVDSDRKVKWSMAAHQLVYIDAEKAREFQAKGYGDITEGAVRPVSEDELAEMLSTVTVLNPGGQTDG